MLSSGIDRLCAGAPLSDAELLELLRADLTPAQEEQLYAAARAAREPYYGKDIFLRGLIEFTAYCKNDCYYCGLRRSNRNAERYRLGQDDILACCRAGYALGFRTFVLQGGEDPYFTDERLCAVIAAVRAEFPDCAITLSVGEKSRDSYQAYFDAGANRYLLRHETADFAHYARLHPPELSPRNRQRCLYDLRDIGYQVGAGMMIGSPGQTAEHLLADLRFLQDLRPHMIGIGPFIPHRDTPFAGHSAGTLRDTLHLLAILRLLFPAVLLPATTALGTIHPRGRELGVLAGANVIMPNLSPAEVREKYNLYDGKICTGSEAAEACADMARRMESIGCRVVSARGDSAVR